MKGEEIEINERDGGRRKKCERSIEMKGMDVEIKWMKDRVDKEKGRLKLVEENEKGMVEEKKINDEEIIGIRVEIIEGLRKDNVERNVEKEN